ncbi:MAG: AAA family ATPase, partial [Hyphomicrobium sp.]
MTENHFAALWALGYHRLVPIIPPDAEISEKSSLAKRKDARGKAVGVKGKAGPWFGLDWIPYEADEQDVTRWHAMGAGVGIKTGQGLVGIDADTLDHDCARTIRDIVEDHVGRLPVRIGNYPKALYLVRVEGEYRYTRVEFGARRENGTLTDRVEILSDGRQFVAHGVHPTTLKPYHWPRPLVPYVDLPIVTPGQLDAMLAAIRDVMPQAAPIVREGATTNINQDALKGDLAIVAKAVRATPNTSGAFPSREAYRDYGYAIKAALPNDQDAAFEIYADWCSRWTDGENDPDIVAADWARMKPPYRRGASWLYDLAERHGNGQFNPAEAWFEPIPEDTNPFAVLTQQAVTQPADTYPVLTIDDLMNRPPPEWLIERYFPKHSVGFVYSAPGAGKTFIILDAAMSIAAALPDWHGDKITPTPGIVLYLAAEGSYGFRNRVKAWVKTRGVEGSRLAHFRLIEK